MSLGCWNAEPHDRPSFRDVLSLLDEISRSEFVMTTHESFREIQEDWHREIEEMFDELRTKEKVASHLAVAEVSDDCLRLEQLLDPHKGVVNDAARLPNLSSSSCDLVL